MKKYVWIIELVIAIASLGITIFAYFIALPEYREFQRLNEIQDINGNWHVNFITEETSYKEYEGMDVQYSIFFLGNKNEYKGTGEKIKIWDTDLEGNQRDRLEIGAQIKKDKMYGVYYLYGKERDSDGNFSVSLSNDGETFSGTFIGNAADSKGTIIGKRK